jgi:hypothetical protein
MKKVTALGGEGGQETRGLPRRRRTAAVWWVETRAQQGPVTAGVTLASIYWGVLASTPCVAKKAVLTSGWIR